MISISISISISTSIRLPLHIVMDWYVAARRIKASG
jgi:hypothetical protein